MNTQQVEVQIMGYSYVLTCPEDAQEKLLAAVNRVDEAMCKIRDAGKIKARDRIAVLAAVNLAFDQETDDADASDAPAAAAHASVSAPSAAGDEASSNARLQQLLARLDQALGQDGQLI